jgi:hypothetical protein
MEVTAALPTISAALCPNSSSDLQDSTSLNQRLGQGSSLPTIFRVSGEKRTTIANAIILHRTFAEMHIIHPVWGGLVHPYGLEARLSCSSAEKKRRCGMLNGAAAAAA